MTPAIRVENLGKRYRVSHATKRRGYRTLRESLSGAAGGLLQRLRNRSSKETVEDFWALKDVSFDVQPGEVVGIIGRNGAGKSTLLKILSQITKPTTGEVRLNGRVGSLLEVGTGFHPELTGRENVYLNGSILGMSRREIAKRFDEIVAFAEIEQFLDTPVKRYSSGMYVRLAFAVAAHLQPEILIVDEVLAVGDAQFQNKCLGKMEEVATQGRTVFVVSHQMTVVQRLCKVVVLLDHGNLAGHGDKDEIIAQYLSAGPEALPPGDWFDLSRAKRSGTGEARFTAARYSGGTEHDNGSAKPDDPVEIEIKIDSALSQSITGLAVSVFDRYGTKLINADIQAHNHPVLLRKGVNRVTFHIHALHLNPDTYTVGLWMAGHGDIYDSLPAAFQLEVTDSGPAMLGRRQGAGGAVTCSFDVSSD